MRAELASCAVALVALLASVPAEAQLSEAAETYRRERLTIYPGPTTDPDGNPAPSVRIVKGDWEKVLTQTEFLDLVGRHDLSLQVRGHDDRPDYAFNWIIGGVVIGVTTLAVGMAMIIGNSGDPTAGCSSSSASYASCLSNEQSQQDTQILIGSALLTAGPLALTAMVLYGAFQMTPASSPDPGLPSADQERALADDYNSRLKAKLGLSADEPTEPPAAPSVPHISVLPMALPGGGGMLLTAQF